MIGITQYVVMATMETVFSVPFQGLNFFREHYQWESAWYRGLRAGLQVSSNSSYIHHQTNTLGKGMNPFILSAMG